MPTTLVNGKIPAITGRITSASRIKSIDADYQQHPVVIVWHNFKRWKW
ncbi:MAG: hypothetical protein P8O22_05035 [Akkermansiaceae bacterium]|nr:hypothetical protein [Akkermansiaceae bacterium]